MYVFWPIILFFYNIFFFFFFAVIIIITVVVSSRCKKTYIRTGRRDLWLLNCRHDPQQYRCFTGGPLIGVCALPGAADETPSVCDGWAWMRNKTRAHKFVHPRAARTSRLTPGLHINIRYHECDGRRRIKKKHHREENKNWISRVYRQYIRVRIVPTHI